MTDRILPPWYGKKKEEDFQVYHEGEVVSYVNSNLAKNRNLSWEDVEKIKELHSKRHDIFEEMKHTDETERLIDFAVEVEEIEFELQALWKFEKNSNFHEWYKVPKCRCPKHDNMDRRGTIYRVINADCPIHGGKME